ncbi:transposase, partial [Neoaquamicrobium sediminum]
MTDILTNIIEERPVRAEILKGPERRRRRTPAEKMRIVEESYAPGVTVSLVARQHGIAPNQ